nr:hypothetical protein Hi04_10k_c5966_00019 [uncultured bacterium]
MRTSSCSWNAVGKVVIYASIAPPGSNSNVNSSQEISELAWMGGS